MIRPLVFALLLGAGYYSANGQDINSLIHQEDVSRVERTLSADDMQGRASFSPGIEKAADFIDHEFREAGLQVLPGATGFRQTFSMIKATPQSLDVQFADHPEIKADQVIVVSTQPQVSITETSGYEKVYVHAGEEFRSALGRTMGKQKNLLVFVDTSFASRFGRLRYMQRQQFSSPYNTVYVLTAADPQRFSITLHQEISEKKLSNLVGLLPGKSLKNEYVIFSSHYDHLGIGHPDAQGDSIFNGANDDASGTTAVIELAKYFAKKGNNERTLVFATFAAEEIGGFGSQYFSRQFNPEQVMAMFNIEMIGTESKWGKNSIYLTGYERTNMGEILGHNLTGSNFSIYPDPYPQQQLFFRSDNATLARQGVAAHTISTSKMDSEKYYHKPGDEFGTLDMANMTEIIKAIATSATSIIAGKDTPTRVNVDKL